jgi:hypothetical protein
MSRKVIDMGAEQELAKFLDVYFYDWLLKNYKFTYVKRNKDKQLQIQGVDVILESKDCNYNIDEKAQLYYINKSLPTFAFEVDFINRNNELAQGWLFNNDLLTDYYFLIWPNATQNDLSKIKAEDFTTLDCLMISKKKIQSYLQSKGWSNKRIFEKARELRNGTSSGKISIQGENDFYFYFSESKYYSEQPINIIIRKNVLIYLADQHYNITKSQVIVMK